MKKGILAGGLLLGGAAGILEGFLLEPNRLDVTSHDLGDLTARPRNPRLLQLSDLHLLGLRPIHEEIVRQIRLFAPDLLVITGDAIDDRSDPRRLEEFLELLPREVPTLAINGNWEHWSGVGIERIAEIYRRHGARLLVNESVLVEWDGGALLVSGLDDTVGGAPDIYATFRGVEPRRDHIILAHAPQQRDHLADSAIVRERYRPAVVLSGHTHGGQVRIGPWAPWLPPGSGGYVSGWYHRDSNFPLYVSRGIGMSNVQVRFGASPELVRMTIGL